MRSLRRPRFPVLTVLAAALALPGCSTVPAVVEPLAIGPSDARVREVFLLQARAADELIDRYPFADLEMEPGLAALDARMTERCAPIAQAVIAHLEGRPIGLDLRWRVFTNVAACEVAARKLSGLLAADRTLATAATAP